MKPILFPADAVTFTTNGLGRMADAVTCRVTEERNGAYQLEMTYPVNGVHFADLAQRMILYAIHDDRKDRQPFRIYETTKPMGGLVTVRARHISYDLAKIPVEPFTAATCADAVAGLGSHSATDCPFTFWTDKEVEGTYTVAVPSALRSLLGGSQGSVLDVYGTGEYEWDHFAVKLHLHRGTDSGVTIRYSKNLTELEDTVDVSGTYNAVYPYWQGGGEDDTLVTLPEKVLYAQLDGADLPTEAVPLDLSGAWENAPTVDQLRKRAAKYLTDNQPWDEKRNVTVSFVPLWQTEEYRDVAALERLRLCDTVTVVHKSLGVKVKKKIIRVEYDVLRERYLEMELGDASTSFTSVLKAEISAGLEEIKKSAVSKSELEKSIDRATDLIRGGLGGYVVTVTNADGQPIELLIVDGPDLSNAKKVWRWNAAGLGYSKNGYDGPYGTAITMDGHIVADYVDTGILNANIIKAGVLSDDKGNTTLNMSTGALTAKKLSVTSTNFTLTEGGNVTAKNASLTNVTATGSFTTSGAIWNYEGTRSYVFDASLNSDGLNFSIDGDYASGVCVSAAVSRGSGGNYDYKALTLNTGLDAIALGLENDSAESADAWTYYFALNNGLNPNGYTERFYMDGDVRILGAVMPWYVDLHSSAGSVRLKHGRSSTSGGGLSVEGYVYASGNMWCGGTKNRAVDTEHYGTVGLTAMESTFAVFSDLGSGVLDDTGVAYIFIDPDFAETVDLRCDYQVFTTPTGPGRVDWAEKHPDHFIVHGAPGAAFDWIIYARQRDYESIRMARVDAYTEEMGESDQTPFYGDNAGANASIRMMEAYQDNIDQLAQEYLENYEREIHYDE